MTTNYDVFISYSHDDFGWVEGELYQRLSRCLTRSGQRPRIFFDRDPREGISVGNNFVTALTEALANSRKVVPVYSWNYFRSRYCKFELDFSLNRMISRDEHGLLNPVLIDPTTELPASTVLFQFASIQAPDWFERLSTALNLIPGANQAKLEFNTQPRDIQVNQTLPVIEIRLKCASGSSIPQNEEEVAIATTVGELFGTTRVVSSQGIARFVDLSLGTPMEQLRLVATAQGFDSATSEPFCVTAAASRIEVSSTQGAGTAPLRAPSIPTSGEIAFFRGSNLLAITQESSVSIYSLMGEPRLPAPGLSANHRIRLQKLSATLLARVDWHANVQAIDQAGKTNTWHLADPKQALTIVGDLALDGDIVYVGLWNGDVYRLTWESPPLLLFKHHPGVQALAVNGEQVLLVDLEGRMCLYRQGQLTAQIFAEARIHTIQAQVDRWILIGVSQMYQASADLMELLSDPSPIGPIVYALGSSAIPLIVDSQGKGRRFDSEFKLRGSFRIQPGAVPTSADDLGIWSVFHNPSGSYSLLERDKIVFTHEGGALAISPDGMKLAVSQHDGIRIVNPKEVASFAKGSARNASP